MRKIFGKTMHTLQEILKFRDTAQFRGVIDRVTMRICDIPWEVTPNDEGVRQAIAYPKPEMNYTSFIRRTLLDMLALNFAMFEVAVTEREKFVLMQCFPAEIFPLKEWTAAERKESFRWRYHDRQNSKDIYLSDQKIAIFPAYGNFGITHDEMWGLPSPVNQILEAIALKLELKSEPSAFPTLDFVHIFDASLTLQNALKEIPEPEAGYASLWKSQFGGSPVQRLKSGIIVPSDPAIILGQGRQVELQGYSDWIVEAMLRVMLHIYRPLLQGTEEEEQVRKAIGDCKGYEDMISAIALIISQGINRLMKNLDIDCKFSFVGASPSSTHPETAVLEQRQTLFQLGYLGKEG